MSTNQAENQTGLMLKKDFPFFETNPEVVYLDSAATSLTPNSVIDEINRYYRHYSVNIHRGVYKASAEATKVYEDTRQKVIKFINAPSSFETVYTRNTTESLNLIAYSFERVSGLDELYFAWKSGWAKGDVILLTESEHHSNIVPWQMLAERVGARIVFVPVLPNGALNLNALEDIKKDLAGETVKIVSLSQVSNVTGIVYDLEPFQSFAREKGALFIVDGAQAVCHQKVDVTAIDCDFYVFSAHKMLGPTGIGVVVGKRSLFDKMHPFLGGGDMILEVHKGATTYNEPPYKFEAGTPNISGVFGLAAAIDYLEKVDLNEIFRWEQELLYYALEKVGKIDGIIIHGPSLEELKKGQYEKVGVLPFGIESIHPHDVGTILDDYKVCIRAGHHCCQLLMQAWNVSATNRASFYLYNDHSDIDKLVEAIQGVQKVFKR
ncbi:MAG: SufS family cysteine desulfurase [Leptospirales bacterium]